MKYVHGKKPLVVEDIKAFFSQNHSHALNFASQILNEKISGQPKSFGDFFNYAL